MNPLGKEQSSVFETLEKGNFIAPAAYDPQTEEDISPVKSAFKLLLPGIALGCLLPALLDGMELAGFLGALLMFAGAIKLTGEIDRFRVVLVCAAVQAAALAFVLVAQTSVPELLEGSLYAMAAAWGVWFGAVFTVRLAMVVGKHYPKCRVPAALAAVFVTLAIALAALFPAVFLVRLVAVLPGVGVLVWLAVSAYK